MTYPAGLTACCISPRTLPAQTLRTASGRQRARSAPPVPAQADACRLTLAPVRTQAAPSCRLAAKGYPGAVQGPCRHHAQGRASRGSPTRGASLPSCADRKAGVLLLWRTRPPCPIRTDPRPRGCVPSRRGPSSCICATAHRCCPGRHHGAAPCKRPALPA